jgi:hypothetical protein
MNARAVLQIDVTKTADAMTKREHDRVIVRLKALGNVYTHADKTKRHAQPFFIAVKLCAQHSVPIPKWVEVASTEIANAIPNSAAWHDVLGSIDAIGFRAARSSEPVGKIMIRAEELGVSLKRAEKIIFDKSGGAIGAREVAPAFEYYKITSGVEKADNPKPKSRAESGDRNVAEKQKLAESKNAAETELAAFAKTQFEEHPVVTRALKKRTQRDGAA